MRWRFAGWGPAWLGNGPAGLYPHLGVWYCSLLLLAAAWRW